MKPNKEYEILAILSKIKDKQLIVRLHDDPCDDVSSHLHKWGKEK